MSIPQVWQCNARAYNCCGMGGPSPMIVRLPVAAGVDTISALPMTVSEGNDIIVDEAPVSVVSLLLKKSKTTEGAGATEDQLHKLEFTLRLLLRMAAVNARS